MAVLTATARQPLPNAPDNIRANKVVHDVTSYLENNRLLVHTVKSAIMVHNVPPGPLRPGDAPMTPTEDATYLGIQQAATPEGVTLPANPEQQLTRILVIACTAALSTQALAHLLQVVLNAAIRFQALHLTHPEHMLQRAVTTVRRAWAIDGHRSTSLPPEVRAASAPYYGDDTNHLVHSAYTAHTATHLHCLIHSEEPEVREVFTLTLREAQHHRNTCPQYILHQRRPITTVRTRICNRLELPLPHHRHVIQTNRRGKEAGPIAVLHTNVGGGPIGDTIPLDQVGTTLHLLRVTPNQMPAFQRGGTHHVPFLQHPRWPNKSLLENHLRQAAVTAGRPQPGDGEIREAYNLFWSTHKQPLPQSSPTRNQAHHQPPEQVGYVLETTVPVVFQLAPKCLKVTLRPGKAQGNLWMLPPSTARRFCPPPLPQDPLTGIPTTCWQWGLNAVATPWPILQLLARHHHTPTAHATPEQHRWLHTHFEPAPAGMLAPVTWQPSTPAG